MRGSGGDWFSRMEFAIIKLIILGLLLITGYKLIMIEMSTIKHPAGVSAPAPEDRSASSP